MRWTYFLRNEIFTKFSTNSVYLNFYSRNEEDLGKLPGHYVEQPDIKMRITSDNTTDDREDEACEESWSDEEGEDLNYTNNYSIRRRRYVLSDVYKYI